MSAQVDNRHTFSDSETDSGDSTDTTVSQLDYDEDDESKHGFVGTKELEIETKDDEEFVFISEKDSPKKASVMSPTIMTRFFGVFGSMGLSPRQSTQGRKTLDKSRRNRGVSDGAFVPNNNNGSKSQVTHQQNPCDVLADLGAEIPPECDSLVSQKHRIVYQVVRNVVSNRQVIWMKTNPKRFGDIWIAIAENNYNGSTSKVPFPKLKSVQEIEIITNTRPYSQHTADHVEQIRRDTPRTLPHFPYFTGSNSANMKKLEQLLLAVSELYPKISYVQGMNFVGAVILFHCDFEVPKSLHLFQIMMDHPKYQLSHLYAEGLGDVLRYNVWLQSIIQCLYPELYGHFESIGLGELFFSYQWIITVFAAAMPLDLLEQVWTYFFETGWDGILRISLVLLTSQSTKLMKSDFESCARILRRSAWLAQGDELLKSAKLLQLPQPPPKQQNKDRT